MRRYVRAVAVCLSLSIPAALSSTVAGDSLDCAVMDYQLGSRPEVVTVRLIIYLQRYYPEVITASVLARLNN